MDWTARKQLKNDWKLREEIMDINMSILLHYINCC